MRAKRGNFQSNVVPDIAECWKEKYFSVVFSVQTVVTRSQAPAAMVTRSALFWDITRRRMEIVYRRFGTTYWSHLHGGLSVLEDGNDTLSRNVDKQLPHHAA
jgi:hypothetical protein